jgi:hypothetical protein
MVGLRRQRNILICLSEDLGIVPQTRRQRSTYFRAGVDMMGSRKRHRLVFEALYTKKFRPDRVAGGLGEFGTSPLKGMERREFQITASGSHLVRHLVMGTGR